MYRFPESLQADIRVHLNHDLFEQFEIFENTSEGSRRALATFFQIELFPHQYYLLKEGDQVAKLYFIATGTVDVIKGQQSVKFLGKAQLLMLAGSVLMCFRPFFIVPRHNSFGRLQLCSLSHATEFTGVCANRTVLTSKRIITWSKLDSKNDASTLVESVYNLPEWFSYYHALYQEPWR